MRTALQNLTDEQIKNRAIEIVRYQNFKSKIALEKMNCTMPKIVFDSGVSYVRKGKINKQVMSKKMLEALDNCVKTCVQPLTPSFEERRIFRKNEFQKKDVTPPASKLEIVNKLVTSKFEYGVKIGDCIKMLDSEKEAKAFIQGAKFVDHEIEWKLVEMELNIVEEK